ncbi:MAG: error-prone DNA polymerase [Myxococcales bacterium]|nr:error-prone DNA polymerase [Myxococcales bacterium]
MYAPLWVKTNFSFLVGASHPEELVEQAHALGLSALAITDLDGVHGIVRAHMRASELGLKLLIGAEVTITEATTPRERGAPDSFAGGDRGARDPLSGRAKPDGKIVLLSVDRNGYGNLCQLISRGRLRSDKGSSRVELSEVCELCDGLIALCTEPAMLAPLREAFGDRLYALITRHLRAEEDPHEQALRRAAEELRVLTVASTEVLYHQAARKPLQDVLACIAAGKILGEAGRVIRQNAEHDLKSARAMRDLFADDEPSLRRSMEVAERCRFTLSTLRYRYPGEQLPDGKSESDWLRELTLQGAAERFPRGVPDAVRDQIERELSLIAELEYGGYFLTMWEIVQFCRRNDILCQGRGSAANSAVCFCLGITAIDPIKLDLLFERFLSRERAEPPDIDLDIEHERREEVIQWVYERYGRRHAAMVANVIRYRLRSAMRDVGKVLGLPLTALDRLSKLMGGRFSDLGREALEYAGLDPEAEVHHHFLELVDAIQDFPRHLSIHPGGFLLGHEPVDTLVPIEPATMEDRTVIQWDKYAVEDLGLFKVDLLGLGALSQLHRCFDLLRRHEGRELSMAMIHHDDVETYDMISRGDTVGVFQIESRAQMSMLPRLKPRTFYDLVIEVAIVRPGPIQGDMVHPYLKRRNAEERADYPHPALERALAKTLGVPIFQEQVMKVAVLVGGYTPGEADQLRRDMAAWKSSGRIERHRDRLISRMIDNGIEPDFAERIFSQIRGFGEYGFPESHAASFALIAYVTAWLRCHHAAAFTCSLLNAQPMGFYSPATLVEDAKRRGVEVRPIDVQQSTWDCTLEDARGSGGQWAIRMGLRYVKGLGTREQEALEWAPPPYRTLEDFMARTKLKKTAYLKLAEAGALDPLLQQSREHGSVRRQAVWEVREIWSRLEDALPLGSNVETVEGRPLFRKLGGAQEVFWDYRTTHHSARGHPIASLRDGLTRRGIPTARELNAMPDGSRTRYVGMTICRQRPGTATGVTFYTLEDETGFVNLVVWSQIFERYSVIARTAVLMGVRGKIQSESGVIHLIADELWEPDQDFDPTGTTTRSFH